MRSAILSISMATLVGLFASASANGAARTPHRMRGATIRKARKTPRQPTTTSSSSRSSNSSRIDEAQLVRCRRIKDALNVNSRKMRDLSADSARYNAEYRSAQVRIKELEQLRANLDKEIRSLKQRLKWERKAFDKKCKDALNCEVYERYVDSLESRMKPLETALADINRRIDKTNQESTDLERQIPPVQQEYSKLKCSALTPGETTQHTIDRCFAMMSDWNRLQTRINDLRDRLPAMEASYISHSQRLSGMQDPIDEYSNYLNSFCKGSSKVVKVRELRQRKDRYNKLGSTISKAMDRLNKLKSVKIILQ